MTSPVSNVSVKGSKKGEDKELEKEDYYNIGKEIITKVGQGPKMCRMGDIYHLIKQRVESLGKQPVKFKTQMTSPRRSQH